ncbi:MAG: hypothetical protein M1582_02235 [Actinobacteria bacterium]|nr:hypothetical protein [Actinomycetota bacterium]
MGYHLHRDEEIASLSRSAGSDEVSTLSRVFAAMAREVKAREDQLREQVKELRIEIDQTRKTKQVEEIISSDYFQKLQDRAKQLRSNQEE